MIIKNKKLIIDCVGVFLVFLGVSVLVGIYLYKSADDREKELEESYKSTQAPPVQKKFTWNIKWTPVFGRHYELIALSQNSTDTEMRKHLLPDSDCYYTSQISATNSWSNFEFHCEFNVPEPKDVVVSGVCFQGGGGIMYSSNEVSLAGICSYE